MSNLLRSIVTIGALLLSVPTLAEPFLCESYPISTQRQSQPELVEPALGVCRLLVILVRFDSDPVDSKIIYAPVTLPETDSLELDTAKARSIIFDDRYPGPWNTPNFVESPPFAWENYADVTLNDFFRENSYDQFRLTGTVMGTYTLDGPLQFAFQIVEAAIAAVVADGVDITWGGVSNPFMTSPDFDRILVLSTRQNQIGLGGARHGDAAWTHGAIQMWLVAHELGHTYGARHAPGFFCPNKVWPVQSDASCDLIGQSDYFNPMGTGSGHFSVATKMRFGWIPNSELVKVYQSGTFELTPVQVEGGIKTLSIPRDTSYYDFQFRHYIGFDGLFENMPIVGSLIPFNYNGLHLYRIDSSNVNYDNEVLDMFPNDVPSNQTYPREHILRVDSTYVDSVVGFSITPLEITGSDESAKLMVQVEAFDYSDFDGDGIPLVDDNCPAVFNPDQSDSNGNGVGDVCEVFTCGDADGNGTVSIGDAVFIINYIFGGGPEPVPLVAADSDCSGAVSIGDAVYLINYIFGGGPAPCEGC